MIYLLALPAELPSVAAGSAKPIAAAETASGATVATIHAARALRAALSAAGTEAAALKRARALALAASSSGAESATLNATRALSAGLWGSSGPGPSTTIHYAAGGNFDSSGPTYVYLLQPYGFNLADASNVTEVDELPAGVKGLVYVGLTNGVDSAFLSFMAPFQSGSHPNLWGFYLSDEPDPNVVPAANLKAESDWIHANLPGVITFIALETLGTPNSPTYVPTSPAVAYNPATTGIDLYGIDPYPVRAQFPGGVDYTVIGDSVAAAIASGIPLAQLVPVYQTFGGGGYPSWTLPTPDQLQELLATWQTLVPAPVFDYTYAWASQLGDSALATSPQLQPIITAHNAVTPTTLGRTRALAMTSASAGATVATLHGTHALASAASSAASEAATILRSRALAVAETAASIMGAALKRARALAASETAIGVTLATLSSPTRALACAATGSSALVIHLSSNHVLSSAAASASVTSVTVRRSRSVRLAVTAGGATQATPAAIRPLSASETATGVMLATLKLPPGHIALITSSTSAATATLHSGFPLRAAQTAGAVATATLDRSRAVVLDAASSSAASASLVAIRALAFAAASGTALSAATTRARALSSAVTASGATLAALSPAQRIRALAAAASSSSVLVIALSRFQPIRAGRVAVIPARYAYGTSLAFAPIAPNDEDVFTFDWTARTTTDPAGDPVVAASITGADLTIGTVMLTSPFVQVDCATPSTESLYLRCAATFQSGRVLHWTARLPVSGP